ncbi:glycosyltransferase family 4 protein [Carnobacterium maltaromaticum]|uniref:Glycosyltransferase family 4 protein n=1 Tax=Carnobacterium maltaromaticum TaxID=2751 RepID=A0AAW9K3E2_CARML|nr:glycosyltransferase family 4 protein [Carnobacterium maltaromaticum]MDZ5759256.1 glycosyltransferase family 4 protein [Carnobacterium maltaromaticum]
MKVAMIGPDVGAKGGVASVIQNFKEHFDESTIQISYYTTWKDGNKVDHYLRSVFVILIFPIFLFYKKISLVHLHVAQKGSFYRKSILLLIATVFKLPTIFHMHASQFDEFYASQNKVKKKYISWVFQRATKVVALSEEWQKYYQSIGVSHCEVIENSVLISKKNDYSLHAKKIVSFGRLGQRKGTYDILTAAKEIEKDYPEYQFILYGDGDIEQVKKQIEAQNIVNVKVGGWIKEQEKIRVLKETCLHLLPSYQEGMPMAILETMANGIPNISSTVGGIPQVIKDHSNGLLVRPGDTKGLIHALKVFLSQSEFRREVSEASYQTIYTRFSLNNYHEKWIILYKTTT